MTENAGQADEGKDAEATGDEVTGAEAEAGDGNDDELGLEARLKRLDEIVAALEGDEVDLDQALALFEEGVGHVRAAEKALAQAELRVEELLGEGPDGETRELTEESG
ncbi:MAG: exodeoxyribonuclease VII small subunit [Gemmatimonadota bacterium]